MTSANSPMTGPEFLHAFRAAPLVMVVTRLADGRIIDVNEEFEKTLGITRSEALGRTTQELNFYDTAIDRSRMMAEIKATGAVRNMEMGARTRDGRQLIGQVSCSLIRVGNEDCLLTTINDVTERMATRARIEEMSALNESLVNGSPIAILIYRHDGQCISANEAAASLVGAPREVLLAQNFRHLESWQRSGLLHAALDVLETGKDVQEEIRTTTTFGRRVCMGCRLARFQHRGDYHLLLMATDDSVRRDAEESLHRTNKDLQAANERLRQVDQEKSAFLAVVAHELRTPAATIMGVVDSLIEGKTGVLGKSALGLVRIAARSVNRLCRLVDNLLDMARHDAGHFRIEPELIDLSTVTRQALNEFRSQADRLRIELCPDIAAASVKIFADPDKITQIISNLLDNGIRHARSRVDAQLFRENGLAVIQISNDGPAIPESEMARLFRPYAVVRSPGAQPHLGLGLFVVKAITDAHNGEVAISSPPEGGARFQVRLPVWED